MESITLTEKELFRLRIVQRILDGNLHYADASRELNLSRRQAMRLAKRLRHEGPAAFASLKRGRPPNNRLPADVRERVLELIHVQYHDFGPTLLAEKLAERHDICVSRETLRQLLISEKLHRARKRRLRPRPMRERRPRLGELTQIDGSPHAWFEERGPRCCLLLANDDATSTILAARFEPVETTDGYFELLNQYFGMHGRPVAIYSDRHSIFRHSKGSKLNNETQMQRALMELDIALLCANSPQAKGRIERAYRTLQDRLLKELRLHNVCTIEQGNAFLPGFIVQYNRRFAKPPAQPGDAHRSCVDVDLDSILVRRYTRKLTKDLTFQIGDIVYAIDPDPTHRFRTGMVVALMQHRDGTIEIWNKGMRVPVRCLGRRQRNAPIVSSKNLDVVLERKPAPKRPYSMPDTHPLKVLAARTWEARLRRLQHRGG
jgi:transposase